jgi:hypothetical protein
LFTSFWQASAVALKAVPTKHFPLSMAAVSAAAAIEKLKLQKTRKRHKMAIERVRSEECIWIFAMYYYKTRKSTDFNLYLQIKVDIICTVFLPDLIGCPKTPILLWPYRPHPNPLLPTQPLYSSLCWLLLANKQKYSGPNENKSLMKGNRSQPRPHLYNIFVKHYYRRYNIQAKIRIILWFAIAMYSNWMKLNCFYR